jgi:hypothetical protein
VFFDLGKVASVEEDALDSSFETIVERILDMKEGHGSALSPGTSTRHPFNRLHVSRI